MKTPFLARELAYLWIFDLLIIYLRTAIFGLVVKLELKYTVLRLQFELVVMFGGYNLSL
jgi:hypothetical protein